METERGKAREEMVAAVEQERERSKVSLATLLHHINVCVMICKRKGTHIHTHTLTHSTPSQELLSEALSEERERSEAAVQRSAEATREQVTTRMNEEMKVFS